MPLSEFRQASFKGGDYYGKNMFARYLHTRFNYQEKAFYCLKRCFLGGLRINSTVYAFLYFFILIFFKFLLF